MDTAGLFCLGVVVGAVTALGSYFVSYRLIGGRWPWEG